MPRFIRRYRRSIAFLLAFLGVLIALSSLRERPQTWSATVVATDLPAGHVLAPGDLRTAEAPVALRPTNALTPADAAVGRVLAGPVAAGELLVEHRLVGPSLLDGSPPGHVAMPIKLDDPAESTFLRPGDIVDVMAARRSSGFGEQDASSATIVTRGVRVLALPGENATSVGGFMGNSPGASSSQGTAVVVGMSPSAAASVAGAAATSRLSLLVQGQPASAQSAPGESAQ
jgi:Flp pilus assembly protein CpaB